MGFRFERVDEVDNVRMRAENVVAGELDFVIGPRVEVGIVGGALANTLDCYMVVGFEIFGQENHAEGPMVEGRNRLKAIVEDLTLDKAIFHTRHVDFEKG